MSFNVIQCPGPGGKNIWDLGDFISGSTTAMTRTFENLDPNKTYAFTVVPSHDFTTTSTAWSVSPRNADDSSRGNLLMMNEYVADQLVSRTFTGASKIRMQAATFTGTLMAMLSESSSPETVYEPYLPYKFYGDIAIPSRYQPATSSDTTLYPSVLNGCGTKALKDIAKANWSIQSTNNFGVQKTTIGTNSTVLPTNSLRIYSNLRTTDPTGGTGVIWVGNNYINFTNLVSIYTTVDGWYNYCQTSGEIIFYPLATSDGSVWNFVKDIQDNVFGYLNAATSEFVKIYGATGTVSTIISNHYMLANGGTPNGN